LVVSAANAPVFVIDDVDFKDGAVGGYLVNWADDGRVAATMALRVLNGERPQDIPIVSSHNTYMFDWRAVKHWGFKERNLPPGSTLLNREPTAWETYKWYLIFGMSLFLLQAVLIAGLLWQRSGRREAEAKMASALEEARESEGRFRLVANTAPVMIWTAGTDRLCTYFNQPWLEFTGRPLEAELGNGWAEGVHGEDLKGCLDSYTRAFDFREPFRMQYRMRRNDGEYRWLLDIGVPRFNQDGTFAGYIGSCLDITDRKHAEEALSGISRRLIDAQEQERTRIARELHDDINQRIAMLGIKLDVFQQSFPNRGGEFQRRLNELRHLAAEIGTEVQGISHRLHSSKLEYLGLVAACKSFCREVADVHKMNVSFTADNVPPALSHEVSLCLFRVLQESLNNAIKHSAAQRFEAQLRGTSTEIELTVRDHGIGFDADEAIISRGLGLISMRERVSVVNGMMSIASKPMRGTEIIVRVPVVEKTESKTISGAA
jgi:PAS domain S-box-containing protein